MNITRRAAAMAFLSSAALFGSSALSAGAAAEKVGVGALRFTSEGPTFIAMERGYFRQEGLDVKLEFFQAAQPMAVAIASGDIDFGVTAITAGLISLAEKGAIKIIGGALREEKGIDGQVILASRRAYDAGLRTPHDLAGKTFGVTTAGSSFHYMAHKIADKEGIRRADIRLKPLQQVGAIVGSLSTGQIDAWSIVPDIGKTLINGPDVKKIGDVADYIPDYQVTVVFTSPKLIRDRAEIVKRFLRARARAVSDFNAALVDKRTDERTRDDVIKIIHKYVMADRPYEIAAPAILNGAMRISEKSALDAKSVADQLEWFKGEKLVPASVTFDMLVDTSFVHTR